MHRSDVDRGFLAHLARDGVFQAFARFDKTGQRRIHAGQEVLVAPEQRAVAVGDQHDHRRVGPREMQRRAAGFGAAPDMAGFLAAGRGAADAAEAMARMPERHRPRQRQQRPFMPRETGAELAQIAESQPGLGNSGGGKRRRAQPLERRVMRRQVEREVGAIVDQAKKHDPPARQPFVDLAVAGAEQHRDRFRAQNDRLRFAALDLDDEALRAPDRHEKALAIQYPGADPLGFAAAQPGPLKAWMRIEIRGSHAAETDMRPAAPQPRPWLCAAQELP